MSMSTTTSFLIGAAALAALCGGNAYGVETEPVTPGEERPEALQADKYQGNIITVDHDLRTIQLERQQQDGPGTFELVEVGEDATIHLDGEEVDLQELQRGDQIAVQVERQEHQDPALGIETVGLPKAKMVEAYREKQAPFEKHGQLGQDDQQDQQYQRGQQGQQDRQDEFGKQDQDDPEMGNLDQPDPIGGVR